MAGLPSLLHFSADPLEIVLRGTVMYGFLWALFRFVLHRDTGSLAITDILLLVLIADASQNAMTGGAQSLADGLLLVLTIAGWSYLLDWSSYRWPAVRRWVEPAPLMLVRNGQLLRANLRREMITIDEVKASLREQGIESLDVVKTARMEADGRISVIRRADAPAAPAGGTPKTAPR
ncbi:DUF421 domain-containing protein [Aquabacterium sp.]|uniref:DUF421 domain-containing protein n=1 Tax=Aquabacterium sp. TaxID=1872578 RepID=UPI002CD11879|nr:YetF domain-containing protein [Aquabacterium sp.]HSW04616.1 YetF domain-containing protein [Aquabacterium sp.]